MYIVLVNFRNLTIRFHWTNPSVFRLQSGTSAIITKELDVKCTKTQFYVTHLHVLKYNACSPKRLKINRRNVQLTLRQTRNVSHLQYTGVK